MRFEFSGSDRIKEVVLSPIPGGRNCSYIKADQDLNLNFKQTKSLHRLQVQVLPGVQTERCFSAADFTTK